MAEIKKITLENLDIHSYKSRFEEKFIPEPTSGCWLWTSLRNGRYGSFRVRKFVIAAHRFSYWIYVENPKLNFVCHKCDTPMCVNPKHLYLGNATTNMRDRSIRNRHKKQIINTNQLQDIRFALKLGFSNNDIAKMFSVSLQAIKGVRQKRTFKYI